MQTWANATAAIHDRLRREAREDRLLVVLRIDQLPADPPPGGAELIEVWRWFQNQPGTGAAIVVDRCEEGREVALARLRALSALHQARVPEDLFGFGVFDPADWRGLGWRPAVVVDGRSGQLERSEPADVAGGADVAVVTAPGLAPAVAGATVEDGVVLPSGGDAAVERSGAKAAPQVTWCGVSTREDLDAFLGSTVRWAEIPVRRGRQGNVVVAGEDGFEPSLDEVLGVLAQCSKGARLRLDTDPSIRNRALRILTQSGFSAQDLTLVERPSGEGSGDMEGLAEAFPGALIEAPLDFLGPVLAIDRDAARGLVERLAAQGVGRFLVRRDGEGSGAVASALRAWGYDVDLGGLESLGSLLAAFEDRPAALSTDFGLATRPRLRQSIDAAMGAAPPTARQFTRRSSAATSRSRRDPRN